MIVCAESSAVLAWLLGEPRSADVRACLEAADAVIASDVTMVECDRVLIRASALGELSPSQAAGRRTALESAAAYWTILRVSEDIVVRARQAFPHEPIRTLDALHLAAALAARVAVPDVEILSLDEHVRLNATALGFSVRPGDAT